MQKAIAYYRVSTKRQGQSGLGREAQQQAVASFANRNNYHLAYTGIWNTNRTLGRKFFEMTDHLGNVLATVLDRKTGATATGEAPVVGGLYDHWHADIAQASDYYPGGMMMPGRYKKYDWSRMGFNGKPKDDEIYGEGNFQDYGMRCYMPQIMRFPTVDALAKEYPELTPYQFAGNTSIAAADLDGNEPDIKFESGHSAQMIGAEGVDKNVYNQAFDRASGDGGVVIGMGVSIGAEVVKYIAAEYAPLLFTKGSSKQEPGTPANNPRTNATEPQVKKADVNSVSETPRTPQPSKVAKERRVEEVGGRYTRNTEVRPSKQSPGQSRAEYVRYKNQEGKTIRSYKDTYDRSNRFQHRKPTTGNPEGTRPVKNVE